MSNNAVPNLIFDFDSTLIKTEGLEELARLVLLNSENKEEILKKIDSITKLGMEGTLSFQDSLSQRLALFSPDLQTLETLNKQIQNQISKSVSENIEFFEKNKNNIYVISGGFIEFIYPVTDILKIPRSHVFANKFEFDSEGKFIGFDKNNLLAKPNGKVNVAKELNLKGQTIVIGDGYTDYEIKAEGLASKFILYTENITRPNLIELSDLSITSINELIRHLV